jgi:hypothetical protein
MKAVIVEIKGKYAAILAENGLVSKVRNRNYEIGQEIVLNNNKAKLIRMTAAAAAAIMIFVTPAWAYLTPYSYVSLDVNPSFEFFVNRFDRVLTVKAFNDDGGEMSKDIDIDGLKNKEIQTAVKSVLNELKNKGYINEGQKDGVIVAASSKSEKKTDILSKKIRAAVSEEVVPEKPEARDDTLTEEPEVIPETDETANNNKLSHSLIKTDRTNTIIISVENMVLEGFMILPKDDLISSIPAKITAIPKTSPVRYSILAWPKGWSWSAGLPEILKPIRVITEDAPSDRLFIPSAVTEMLLNNMPVTIFPALKRKFAIIPVTLAVMPYDSLTFWSLIFS